MGAEKKKRKMGRMERAYGESRLHQARGGSERIGGRGAECCGDGEVAEHHHHNIYLVYVNNMMSVFIRVFVLWNVELWRSILLCAIWHGDLPSLEVQYGT